MSIKSQTLDQAIIDAIAFIKAAKRLRAARNRVESGACHRASMELTRKLADLRQGR